MIPKCVGWNFSHYWVGIKHAVRLLMGTAQKKQIGFLSTQNADLTVKIQLIIRATGKKSDASSCSKIEERHGDRRD